MSRNVSLTIDEIKSTINTFKKIVTGDAITNYYWQNKREHEKFECLVTEESILFTEQDAGLFRLYFYSKNIEELTSILQDISVRPLVIDYIANGPINMIDDAINTAGFRQYAKMLRFRSTNIPRLEPSAEVSATPKGNRILSRLGKFFAENPVEDIIQLSTKDDAGSVLNILYGKLDKFVGHFPSLKELTDLIEKQQVLVIKDKGVVSGTLIFKLTGKTCNLDQGYSDPANPEIINVKLFFEFYGILNKKDIKSMYLWVEQENKIVINLHKTFGLKPDGVVDYIYTKA